MKDAQTFESFNQNLADSVGGFLENPLTPQRCQKMKKNSFWSERL